MRRVSRYMSGLLTHVLVAAIAFYQCTIRLLIGGSCRFHPTCSTYAIESIRTHGPVAGCRLALKRLSRCHGWSVGGYDPVPPRDGG